MKTFSLIVCILCIITVGVSCTQKTGTGNSGSSLLVCEYADLSGKDRELRLSDFVEDCRVVRFENTDNAFFKAWFIHATENYICIRQGASGAAPCKLFDKAGHFLCDVGSVGNGPGEYYMPVYDAVVDEKRQRIFLVMFHGSKIMVYGMDGKWIKDIPVPIEGRINKPKIRLNEDGTLTVVHMPMWTNPDSPLAFCMDMDGKLIKQLAAPKQMLVRSYNGEIFSSNNCGRFEFQYVHDNNQNPSRDTIFVYDVAGNRIVPEFAMSFPEPENRPLCVLRSIPQGVFASCYYWDEKANRSTDDSDYFIDRQTGKGSRFVLVNDFYGNLPVENPMMAFHQGYYVECFEPYELLEKIEEHLSSGDCPKGEVEKLKALAASVHEEDNNVLFIGKLKQR